MKSISMSGCCTRAPPTIQSAGTCTVRTEPAPATILAAKIVPYVVVSSTIASGLRTTDTVQRVQSVSLRGYFSVDRIQDARAWQTLVEELLTCKRCVPLGDCGCFCVRSVGQSTMTPVGTLLSVFVTVTGTFSPAEETSGSGS